MSKNNQPNTNQDLDTVLNKLAIVANVSGKSWYGIVKEEPLAEAKKAIEANYISKKKVLEAINSLDEKHLDGECIDALRLQQRLGL